ncbi:MAG: glycosyltransferase family protein [Pirellulaceae bacterium]
MAAFHPEVVYSWLGSNRQMALVRRICAARGIPVVPHFMDDWLSSNLTQPLLGFAQSMTFKRSMGKLLRHCPEGVGISVAMAEEYTIRLGIPMSYAANGVEDEILTQLQGGLRAREIPDSEFRFSIIGRLEYGRVKLLADFIKGIQGLASPGRQIVLAIFSDSPLPESLLRNTQVRIEHLPGPTNSDLRSLQARTDCLLYVDDFGKFARRYFRLSFSGKIPVCLALGRPIITIGPHDLNSVTYLRDCQVGPVVTRLDAKAFGEAAREVVTWGPEKRIEVGMHAWSCAQREHRAEEQRARLREVLCRHVRL